MKRLRKERNMSFDHPPFRRTSILTLGRTALGSIIATITMKVLTMNQTGAAIEGPGPHQPPRKKVVKIPARA